MPFRKPNESILPLKVIAAAAVVGAFAMTPRITIAGDEPERGSQENTTSTGSRINHKNRGPLTPIRVIDRAEIDASGDVSIAELLRDSNLAVFGNRRPFSASQRHGMSELDLLGLGAARTLVLLDGRPMARSPVDDAVANLNLIPIGVIERIEILPEGAAAVHGGNAVAGVVNLITRKQFSGAEVSYMIGNPSVRGGDVARGDATYGAQGERGSVTATVSYNQRDIVFARDQIGGDRLTPLLLGNNYRVTSRFGTSPDGPLTPMPGFDCSGNGRNVDDPNGLFYLGEFGATPNACLYNGNGVLAHDASTDTSGLFVAGDFRINDRWTTYLHAQVSRNESQGRLAPSATTVFVPENSLNDPVPGDGRGALIDHRFAAAGGRDVTSDENATDLRIGFKGRVFDQVDLDFGARMDGSQVYWLGRNHIVEALAARAVASGAYDVRDPFGNDAETLDSISTTVSRDASWRSREAFLTASFDTFEMAGGHSPIVIGAQWRDEDLGDRSDSLQMSGQVLDAIARNMAADRSVLSLHAEWLFPISDSLDISAAARFDDHSDAGSEFSPKVAAQWRATPRLMLHGSYGKGFAARPLSVGEEIDSLCLLLPPSVCDAASLEDSGTEQSRNTRVGVAYEINEWFGISGAYYEVAVDNPVQRVPDIRDTWTLLPGLSVLRDPVTGAIITIVVVGPVREETAGADLAVRSTVDLDALGVVSSALRLTHVERRHTISGSFGGTDPIRDNSAGTHGFPQRRATLSHDWTRGDFGVHWQTHFIDGTPGSLYHVEIGGHTTHDLQVRWKAPWRGTFAMGATNLSNKQPTLDSNFPYESTGLPWNFRLYDGYGRTPYLRYTHSF